MYAPWTYIFHIMPFSYYVRSALYQTFAFATFETCEPGTFSAICIQEDSPGAGVPGTKIIEALSQSFPLASSEDTTLGDTMILIVIGCVWKVLYAFGVILKTRRVASIAPPTAYGMKGVGAGVQEQPVNVSRKVTGNDSLQALPSKVPVEYFPYRVPDDLTDEVSV